VSERWAGGSTRAWRDTRAAVLDRDRWTCQLCGERIPRGLPRDDPDSAQVHHTRDRRLVGDDPRYLVASHRRCNLTAGDPTAADAPVEVPGWLAARLRADGAAQ
jgi:5-methylcytosine-specific restriction endonuclease McrA